MTTETAEYDEETIAKAFEEALDDVHTRFLLNLPPDELASTDRIFFQLEQAWWFYDDFHCDHSDIPLPRFKGVKSFALKLFELSPLLKPMLPNFEQLWGEFSVYKRSISTYGTILLNAAGTKVVLCQVWNGKSWTFPAGKVNQHEAGTEAGARETYEETGFDPNCNLGLTNKMLAEHGQNNLQWKPLDQDDGLVYTDDGKRRTCFVCHGVPEDFPFAPVARKEVSAVEWHDIDNLPKKTYAVLPFMSQLRRWIRKNVKKQRGKSTPKRRPKSTTPNKRRANSAKKSRSRNNSRGKVREGDISTETGLASPGQEDGWDEAAMFKANEELLGRKITYDGNPHYFSEKGFDGNDPHAFHVVGGSFMNSGGITKLAPAPDQSRLQPLFRREEEGESGGLQPFFSDGGETPWGEVVSDALAEEGEKKKTPRKKISKKQEDKEEAGQALLKILQKGGQEETVEDSVFMTDAQITARSQMEKATDETPTSRAKSKKETSDSLAKWVQDLPQAPPTRQFGDFRFDVDAIMESMNLGVSS